MTFVSLSAPAGWTCSTPAGWEAPVPSIARTRVWRRRSTRFSPWLDTFPPGTTAGTIYTNTASVFAKVFDPNEKNNSSSASNTVAGPTADLAVFKQAVADQVLPGSNVTYTIQVINGGPSNAATATLNDTLPGTLTFVSLSAPAGWTCSTPAVGAGGTISCSNPSLSPGSGTFTLVANVPAGTPLGTDFSNTALVSSSTFDPDNKNNSSTASIIVVSCLTDPIVTTNANSGPGSLRQAIFDACPGSTITFDMAQVVSPITLTSGELLIDKNLTILGPDANVLTVQRTPGPKAPAFRIFNVTVATGEGLRW